MLDHPSASRVLGVGDRVPAEASSVVVVMAGLRNFPQPLPEQTRITLMWALGNLVAVLDAIARPVWDVVAVVVVGMSRQMDKAADWAFPPAPPKESHRMKDPGWVLREYKEKHGQ
jgi:hypothetical protein